MKYRCAVDPVLQSRMSRGTLMLYCLLLYITDSVCVSVQNERRNVHVMSVEGCDSVVVNALIFCQVCKVMHVCFC